MTGWGSGKVRDREDQWVVMWAMESGKYYPAIYDAKANGADINAGERGRCCPCLALASRRVESFHKSKLSCGSMGGQPECAQPKPCRAGPTVLLRCRKRRRPCRLQCAVQCCDTCLS